MDPQTIPAPEPRKFSRVGLLVVVGLLIALIVVTIEFLRVGGIDGMFQESAPKTGIHIYPGATYTGTTETNGVKAYNWTSPDDFDQVFNYYRINSEKDGWSCSGERTAYVSSFDASGKGTCMKGAETFDLAVTTKDAKTTIGLTLK